MTEQLTWQDALDPQLTRRLIHPLVQPGVIDTRMAREIIVRSQTLNHRLPLLAQLQQRGVIKTTQPEQVPIVYAVPLPKEASAGNHTPALPTIQNSQTTQPLVVQAKFANSNDSSVSPKLLTKPSSPLAPNAENPIPQIQIKLDGHQASLDGTKNLSTNLGENLSISPSPISAIDRVPIVYPQPLLPNAEISQSTLEQPDKQNFQISQLPVVQGKMALPNNSPTEQLLFSDPSLAGIKNSNVLEIQLHKKGNVKKLILSRDSRSALPKDSVGNLLSSQLSAQQIPIVHANAYDVPNSQQLSSQGSQRPVVQVTSQLNSLLSSNPELLIFASNFAIAQQKASVKSPAERISNEYRETLKQGTQAPTKLPFEGIINQISTNTISQTPDSIGLSPITSNQVKNSFDSENYLESKISLDALADKLEHKLMRRLVVETERRGKMQWR